MKNKVEIITIEGNETEDVYMNLHSHIDLLKGLADELANCPDTDDGYGSYTNAIPANLWTRAQNALKDRRKILSRVDIDGLLEGIKVQLYAEREEVIQDPELIMDTQDVYMSIKAIVTSKLSK